MPTIAIIGQGSMARVHAAAWSALVPEESIRYVCALGPERPLEHARSARFVTDLDVVLSDPEVDIVSVCTPTPTHADIAIRALEAGKNVLLEKPIALTIEDAISIRDAAQGSRGILMVAHVVRFFAGYRRVREIAASGRLGRAASVRAQRVSSVPVAAPWWLDESQSGGVIVDFSIHDFDQVNLLLGEPISVLATRTGVDEPIETTVGYKNGGIGQVHSYMGASDGFPFTSSLQLLGREGIANCHFSARSRNPFPSTADGGQAAQTFSLATTYSTMSDELDGDEPYVRQAEYFLSCVREGQEPLYCPTDSAILALQVSLAARESLKTGARISVEPHPPGSAQ